MEVLRVDQWSGKLADLLVAMHECSDQPCLVRHHHFIFTVLQPTHRPHGLIDSAKVLHPTRRNIGHFRDVSRS